MTHRHRRYDRVDHDQTRWPIIALSSTEEGPIEEVNKILESLLGEGVITITLQGKQEMAISKNTKEVYTWVVKES